MMIFRFVLASVILSFTVITGNAQTVCERIQKVVGDMEDLTKLRAPANKIVTDADADYLLMQLSDTENKLKKLADGAQADDIREYRLGLVVLHGKMGSLLMNGGMAEKAYAVLNSVDEIAWTVDDDMLKDFHPVKCLKADGSEVEISSRAYQAFAVNFYYSYIAACAVLNKNEEADKLFAHFSRYDFWKYPEAAYITASVLVRSRRDAGMADAGRLSASTYMLRKYMKQGINDSTYMSVNDLLRSLNDPILADTMIPSRANDLYLIYQEMEFYRLKYNDDILVTESVQSECSGR
jgi:hypothetical protein